MDEDDGVIRPPCMPGIKSIEVGDKVSYRWKDLYVIAEVKALFVSSLMVAYGYQDCFCYEILRSDVLQHYKRGEDE